MASLTLEAVPSVVSCHFLVCLVRTTGREGVDPGKSTALHLDCWHALLLTGQSMKLKCVTKSKVAVMGVAVTGLLVPWLRLLALWLSISSGSHGVRVAE